MLYQEKKLAKALLLHTYKFEKSIYLMRIVEIRKVK